MTRLVASDCNGSEMLNFDEELLYAISLCVVPEAGGCGFTKKLAWALTVVRDLSLSSVRSGAEWCRRQLCRTFPLPNALRGPDLHSVSGW